MSSHEPIMPRPPGWTARLCATVFGLQCKATVLIVGVTLLVAVALCSVSVQQAWRLVASLETEQAIRQAHMVARVCAQAWERDDRNPVAKVLDEFVHGGTFLFAEVTDSDKSVIASATSFAQSDSHQFAERSGESTLIGRPVRRTLRDSHLRYLDLHYPINAVSPDGDSSPEPGPLLGYLRIGIRRDRIVQAFNASADLTIGTTVAIVVLAVPLAFIVVRRIVAPLNTMSRTTQRLTLGDLRARADIQRDDEIGVLARNLNIMADEVERKHNVIVTLNSELEQRVMERTAQLRELAVREPLTGLFNRRHFSEVLARRFSEARRYGVDLALLMIDVDNFKSVNDRLGHQAGDELLILAAQTITGQLRAADVAARLGGDEFIIFLPQSNGAHAQALANRIVSRFHTGAREKFPGVETSLSVGIASLKGTRAESDQAFVHAADQALYEAKSAGKDCVASADPVLQ